jgi:hypothetical protein
MPEEQILTTDPEHAFTDSTDGESVTGQKIIIDGSVDKEATQLSAWAGASSTAAPNSGVPSAQTQHGLKNLAGDETGGTYVADRFLKKAREA